MAPDLAQQVRDALTNLYDPGHLQTHPLAAAFGGGRALRGALIDAVEALKPAREGRPAPRAARRYELMRMRYVDALPIEEVQSKLLISRSEYYREHERAIEAVASLLRQRAGPGAFQAEPEPEPVASPDRGPVMAASPLQWGESGLPRPLSSFVGRQRELAQARARLGTARLVTLTGAPGSGKTRLAVQVAHDVAAVFPARVVFVALSLVDDPDLVLSTVARTMAVDEVPGRSALAGLIAHIGDREMLLVLDNCEQVVAAGPDIATLLAACSGLKVLITSREPLRVSGEHVYAVPALALPDAEHAENAEQLLAYDAVRLFVERARAAGVEVGDGDAAIAAQICARLDGLPLAIELAAARVRLLPPRALLARLDHRLPVLIGGARDLPDRQRTLRGALAWSHELLDEPERALFRRLGVFVGGATLDTVEAVCMNAGGEPDPELFDRLGSLVDKSLVDQHEARGEPRFTMLETVREYALEHLDASAEAAAVRHAHAAYFVELAEAAEPQVFGGRAPPPEQPVWLDRLELERANLRAACQWAVTECEAQIGLRLVGALMPFWLFRGSRSEARAMIGEMLALAPGASSAVARARALGAAGGLAWVQGDLAAARGLLNEALALCEHTSDRKLGPHLMRWLAFVSQAEGNVVEARRLVAEGMAIVNELGSISEIAFWTYWLGILGQELGEAPGTRDLIAESLALFDKAGDDWGMAIAHFRLGLQALLAGELADAAAEAAAAARFYERIADQGGMADAQNLLAYTSVRRGDLMRARELYRACLPAHRDQLNRAQLTWALEGVAVLAAGAERHASALRLAAAAAALRKTSGGPVLASGRDPDLSAALERAADAVGAEAAATAEAEGETMTLDQSIAEAISEVAQAD